jgi:hypothetical protein
MAITQIEYALLRYLKTNNLLPQNPQILEFGENNWYGDVPFDQFRADIAQSGRPDILDLQMQLDQLMEREDQNRLFDLAKLFWQVFVNYQSITAIDLGGLNAHQFDLNYPVVMDCQFELTVNFGTAEHIFNVCQFFATMHELTKPGGIMLHGLPFTGWLDHGFYNFQPTFIWDLAAQTGYEVLGLFYAQLSPFKLIGIQNREELLTMSQSGNIGQNAMLYAVLRKGEEADFFPPIQGFYNQTISPSAQSAWYNLR